MVLFMASCVPSEDAAPPATPTVVGAGTVSTDAVEHNASVTPDGSRLYFTRNTASWGQGGGQSTILVSEATEDGWGEPEPAPFSGEHNDSDAFVSPDGSRLFFVSDRPTPDGSSAGDDIWVVSLAGGGLGEPTHVAGVNSHRDEYSPVVAADGTLYFASARTGGLGQGDLYSAEPTDGGYSPPVNLGPSVNSPFGEWNVVVDPEERILVFESSGRALNRSEPGDLYVSFSTDDGWSASRPLDAINTPGSDLMPRFSPGGDVLYYASSLELGATHTDLYAVAWAPLEAAARQAPFDALIAVSRSGHELVVIDPQTLQVLRRVPTGTGPHEAAPLPDGRAAVANYGFFPTPHDTVATSHPGWMEVPEGNTVSIVDLRTGEAMRTLTVDDCARMHGIIPSAAGELIWVTCENEAAVVEIDVASGTVTQRWETGAAGSHRVAATHNDRFLTVTNVEAGSTTVLDRETGERTVLDTGDGSEGIDLGSSETVWVAASGDELITQVDPAVGTVLQSWPSGGVFPISLDIATPDNTAWIAHMGPRAVHVRDLADGSLTGTIEFESAPLRVLVVPGSRHVYVSLPRENAVAVVDRNRMVEVGRIPGVMEVDGLVWTRLPEGPEGQTE